MEPATKVIFRVYSDGEVLALFPEISMGAGLCMSYQHIGQHSGADYAHCIARTRPAKPAEYIALKRELRRIGYALTTRTRYVRRRK